MPSSTQFVIETESLGPRNIHILRISGHLDAHTFEQLEEALTQLFEQGHYRIIVDLHKVQYISSAGAGVFIGSLSEAQEHGGNIALLNPTSNVREVFDLLGLTSIFPVAYDLNAALAVFPPSGA